MDLKTITALIQQDLELVNTHITNALTSKIPLIEDLGYYVINSGGKRIRPIATILAARSVGYQEDKHIELAAIMEMIHTSTLLHDDVVDNSTMRRGEKTANSTFGNSASILVGDFIYSRSFQMIADLNQLDIIKILAKTTNILAEGEVMQLSNTFNFDMSEDMYYDTIYSKTASLFESTSQLGAILAQAKPEHESALASYGKYLGIAFQIVDDMLDYTSKSDELGKNIGDDLAEGKITLPLIYALQHSDCSIQEKIKQSFENQQNDSVELIKNILIETEALDYCHKQASKTISKAIDALAPIPESPYKQALVDLAMLCIERKK